MSLFDSIQFSYPLPLPKHLGELTADEIQSCTFQTKSFDCGMTFYKVDESGQLFRERWKGEWVEGDKNAKSVMDRIGFFSRTKEWLEPQTYTGIVNFYELFQSDNNKNDYWVEYNATFVNGKICKIDLKEYKIKDNAARKEREKEFFAKM